MISMFFPKRKKITLHGNAEIICSSCEKHIGRTLFEYDPMLCDLEETTRIVSFRREGEFCFPMYCDECAEKILKQRISTGLEG